MAFLKLGVSGRAVGMAEAYTAIADDASATYWNPAGLAQLNSAELMFTQNQWLQDVRHNFFALAFGTKSHHFGLSFISNTVDGIERRTKPSTEPIGTFEAHELAVGLSYAKMIGNSFGFGVTLKYLYERIYIESSPGAAVDLGCLYSPAWLAGFRMGAVLQNLGKMSDLQEDPIELPTAMRAGVAYSLPGSISGARLLIATDVAKIFKSTYHANLGMEVDFRRIISLRCGYQTGWDEKGLNGGFGFRYSRYAVDYGFTPFTRDLGSSHRISLNVRF